MKYDKTQGNSTAIPNGVIGMIFFVAAESMLFAALLSAYRILRAGVPVWPPYDQPFLPQNLSMVNSLILLSSGYFLFKAWQSFKRGEGPLIKKFYRNSVVLGLVFVAIQGYEWIQLIAEGLTLTSSIYGGLFYLLVGVHGLHALAALIAMWFVYLRMDKQSDETIRIELIVIQLLWFFVVAVWPVIYWMVYK